MKSTSASTPLSSDEIEALAREIMAEAQAGRKLAVGHGVQKLREAQRQQPEAAMALLWVIDERCLDRETAIDVLSDVAEAHDQDARILSVVGV